MKLLFLLNDAPYGSQWAYNALRLAGSAARQPGVEVKVFLIDGRATGLDASSRKR